MNFPAPSERGSCEDGASPLVYGPKDRLDPGTKLLDVGLHQYTPIRALRKLAEDPAHMSVALHEITHFVSLENTLGHLLGFWAYLAHSLSDGLLHFNRSGQEVHPGAIHRYHMLRRHYRLLMEAWLPLLEGLAVYVQTHHPDEEGDAWIAPLSLLVMWNASVNMVGEQRIAPMRSGPLTWDELSGGLLTAGYRAIRKGPHFKVGDRPFAVTLEMLEQEGLRPYFLGHAYIRAMQRCLSRACPDYESSERFIELVLRILRSSTKRLLRGDPQWDLPAGADLPYGWIDIVRQAEPGRIAALSQLDDNIDVLRFLETGDSEVGYGVTEADLVQALRELVPGEWEAFDGRLAERRAARTARGLNEPALGPGQFAERMVTHWIRGTACLNLSMAGEATIAGMVPNGFRPRHALALKVEDRLWWIATNDADLTHLVGTWAQMPTLDEQAIDASNAQAVPDTARRVRIDCFASYTSEGGEHAALHHPPRLFPQFIFELYDRSRRGESILASIVPMSASVPRCNLEVIADVNRSAFHGVSRQMRGMVQSRVEPRDLAKAFEQRGNKELSTLLQQNASEEDLAVARVEEHVTRRILRALLGKVPESNVRLPLLSKGIGMIEGVAEMEPFIAAAYGTTWTIDQRQVDGVDQKIRAINERSRCLIGKSLFSWCPRRGHVSYCGLWGDP